LATGFWAKAPKTVPDHAPSTMMREGGWSGTTPCQWENGIICVD